jgi:hypothetical protein
MPQKTVYSKFQFSRGQLVSRWIEGSIRSKKVQRQKREWQLPGAGEEEMGNSCLMGRVSG